ncbi:hypothetical protein [Mycobacterium sp.]|uniref:hypothetical protein n=1 Tax=Mycobacterium sp. TaxID=1785 RepID=UPI0031E214A8
MAATGALAAAPFTSRTAHPPVRSVETRLVDAGSVLNVPVNLFDDLANIPYNEVQGLNVLSDSLLFSGNIFVPNATNLFGTDPGDIGHYMGIIDTAIPFSSISGLDQPEIDPTADAAGTAGLGQQLALLAAAELPISASCDAETCAPIVPTDVVTGSTEFDRDIEFLETITGQEPLGIFDHWFTVPLSDLTSGDFTFTSADDAGLVDPSPDTGPDGAVNSLYGFDGTTGADGATAGLVPWAGDTFKLNLFGPFEDFYNSLLATPSTSGIDGTGIEIPTLTDFTQSLQNFAASLVVTFDPAVEGSPVCPAACDVPESLSSAAMVQDIENLDPSNTTLQTYLNGLVPGTNMSDSAATTPEVDASIAVLQTGIFNLPPTELATEDADLAAINPELPALFTNSGILTDPGYLTYADAVEANQAANPPFDPVYGGLNPELEGQDLLTLLTNNDTSATALSDPSNLLALVDPGYVVADSGAAAASSAAASSDTSSMANDGANLSALLGLGGASTLPTDFGAMLSQLSTDITTTLSAELGTSLSTDLGTTLPTDLLSLF